MSRSCHRATFSNAAMALARSSRARPTICSQPIGLRLCGIADEPFWPLPNGSSTSPISVFCRPRISRAKVSSDAPVIASADSSSAWRSRWMTWVEIGAGSRPSWRQTSASTDGSRWAKVPTAPEILPTRTASRAPCRRPRSRPSWSYHSASFRPKVIGSAWTPCVRPIIGVRRCSLGAHGDGGAQLADQPQDHVDRLHQLQRLRGVDDVRRGEPEVQPAGRGPDVFGHRRW